MIDVLQQQGVFTLTLAAAYALFATGFILVFGVLDVLNLAHAFVFMFSASVAVWMANEGVPILLAMIAAVVVGVLLGLLLDFVAYRPVATRKLDPGLGALGAAFPPVVTTLGIAFVIHGVAANFFGTEAKSFPRNEVLDKDWVINDVRVTLVQIGVMVTAVIVLTVLARVLARSSFGRAVRSVAENRDMAAQLGVNTARLSTYVWMIASALAAVAGICIALLYRSVSPEMGANFEMKGFIAVILGGVGSVWGAVIAALLLAVLETGSVLMFSSQMREIITLSTVVIILLIRPHGLIGSKSRDV